MAQPSTLMRDTAANLPPPLQRGLTIQQVQNQLTAMLPEIAHALPQGVTPERFRSVAITAIQNVPKLLQCDPQSLFNACMKAAQDGLLPDGREGAIIPRGNQASWQPMVFGIVTKAKRRGSVANLVANIVYAGEPFEVLMGDDDRIAHRRDIAKVIKGKEIAVYAIATMKDGTKEREVMTWQQVQDVRRMSNAPNADTWTKSEGEMARKTVIRRLAKRLPSLDDGDDELRDAIERVDDHYDFGKPAAVVPSPAAEKPAQTIDSELVIDRPKQRAEEMCKKISEATSIAELATYEADPLVAGDRDWFREYRPELEANVRRAMDAAIATCDPPEETAVGGLRGMGDAAEDPLPPITGEERVGSG